MESSEAVGVVETGEPVRFAVDIVGVVIDGLPASTFFT